MDAAHARMDIHTLLSRLDASDVQVARMTREMNLITKERIAYGDFGQEAVDARMQQFRGVISGNLGVLRQSRSELQNDRLFACIDTTARGKVKTDLQARVEKLRGELKKLEDRLPRLPQAYAQQSQAHGWSVKAINLGENLGVEGNPDERSLKDLRKEGSKLLAGYPELPLGLQADLVKKLRQTEISLAEVRDNAIPNGPNLNPVIYELDGHDVNLSNALADIQKVKLERFTASQCTKEVADRNVTILRRRLTNITQRIRKSRDELKNGQLFECVDRTVRVKLQKNLQATLEKQRGEVRQLEDRLTRLPGYYDLQRRACQLFAKADALHNGNRDLKKLKELRKEISQFISQNPQLPLDVQVILFRNLQTIQTVLDDRAQAAPAAPLAQAPGPRPMIWTQKQLKQEVLRQASQAPQVILARARVLVQELAAIGLKHKDAGKRKKEMERLFTEDEKQVFYRIIGVEKGEKPPHIEAAIYYGKEHFGKEFRFVQQIAINTLRDVELQMART